MKKNTIADIELCYYPNVYTFTIVIYSDQVGNNNRATIPVWRGCTGFLPISVGISIPSMAPVMGFIYVLM